MSDELKSSEMYLQHGSYNGEKIITIKNMTIIKLSVLESCVFLPKPINIFYHYLVRIHFPIHEHN